MDIIPVNSSAGSTKCVRLLELILCIICLALGVVSVIFKGPILPTVLILTISLIFLIITLVDLVGLYTRYPIKSFMWVPIAVAAAIFFLTCAGFFNWGMLLLTIIVTVALFVTAFLYILDALLTASGLYYKNCTCHEAQYLMIETPSYCTRRSSVGSTYVVDSQRPSQRSGGGDNTDASVQFPSDASLPPRSILTCSCRSDPKYQKTTSYGGTFCMDRDATPLPSPSKNDYSDANRTVAISTWAVPKPSPSQEGGGYLDPRMTRSRSSGSTKRIIRMKGPVNKSPKEKSNKPTVRKSPKSKKKEPDGGTDCCKKRQQGRCVCSAPESCQTLYTRENQPKSSLKKSGPKPQQKDFQVQADYDSILDSLGLKPCNPCPDPKCRCCQRSAPQCVAPQRSPKKMCTCKPDSVKKPGCDCHKPTQEAPRSAPPPPTKPQINKIYPLYPTTLWANRPTPLMEVPIPRVKTVQPQYANIRMGQAIDPNQKDQKKKSPEKSPKKKGGCC